MKHLENNLRNDFEKAETHMNDCFIIGKILAAIRKEPILKNLSIKVNMPDSVRSFESQQLEKIIKN